MSKKIKTILTFGIKIELPVGGDASSMQKYIRNAMMEHRKDFANKDPYQHITEDCFTVALQKKETQYG